MDWASTVAVAMVAALLFGYAARRLGLSPLVGYLIAGAAIGPHTPGFVGDVQLAGQLADVGVVLLMFGVGMSFSFGDLWSVRRLALPGALLAVLAAVLGGAFVGAALGWSLSSGLLLGMCLGTASTVVIVRGLLELDLMKSPVGRLAIGWSVVEDLVTVLLLVILPALAPGDAAAAPSSLAGVVLWTIVKVVAMAAVVVVGGGIVVPRLLSLVARAQSKELFTLAVLVVALGVAHTASTVFGVSLALGAFFAGMVVGRSDLSHQAAADALPLRDAFAVLFFVAVGMLFDPGFVLAHPLLVLACALVVLVVKPGVVVSFLVWRGAGLGTALAVAAGVAQVSEFSFVLSGIAVGLGLVPAEAQQLVVATALLTITASPLLFRGSRALERWLLRLPAVARRVAAATKDLAVLAVGAPPPEGHVVLCGHGRVGRVVAELLTRRGVAFVVIDLDRSQVEGLRAGGVAALYGEAGSPVLLDAAGLARARALVLTTSDRVANRLAREHAQVVAPDLPVLVRVHSEEELAGAVASPGAQAIHGERELGFAIARRLLQVLGASAIEAEAAVLAAQEGLAATSELRLHEILVPAESPGLGKGLGELGLPPSVLIVAIVRGRHFVVPRGPTTIAAGDTLLLLGNGDEARHVEAMLSRAPNAGPHDDA
ncbi:MAG: cation:proton antiporter [Planctomycetes bacterium]|nr:cation:proton antiporter [Planctomycetota bacterium]